MSALRPRKNQTGDQNRKENWKAPKYVEITQHTYKYHMGQRRDFKINEKILEYEHNWSKYRGCSESSA